jgi:hypothetical protein
MARARENRVLDKGMAVLIDLNPEERWIDQQKLQRYR